VSSTDCCNKLCEPLRLGLAEEGLSRTFVELPYDSTELGLAMYGQVGATWEIFSNKFVFSFEPRCQGIEDADVDLNVSGYCRIPAPRTALFCQSDAVVLLR
jgi:hypothetical protein